MYHGLVGAGGPVRVSRKKCPGSFCQQSNVSGMEDEMRSSRNSDGEIGICFGLPHARRTYLESCGQKNRSGAGEWSKIEGYQEQRDGLVPAGAVSLVHEGVGEASRAALLLVASSLPDSANLEMRHGDGTRRRKKSADMKSES